jgi:diguanylate cyclase (GGDEF)-like protein/PAS domain S-box-containing protein
MGKLLKSPIVVMAVPIFDSQGKVVGALAGGTNLGKPNFLDKITQSMYGKSGGYFLIDLKHRMVVTATDKNRVMQALPAPGINPLIDRFIGGYEGYAVLVNAVGVGVLSSSKVIPVAGWAVSASLPTAEAFAPLQHRQQRLLWATLVLAVLVGALTWLVLRRELAPLVVAAKAMTKLANSKDMPQPLPEAQPGEIGELMAGFNRILGKSIEREDALSASESFKEAVLDSLDAEIAVVDRNGVIQAVNARWQRFALENSPEAGRPALRTGVGASYLAACDGGSGADAENISEVRAGLQSVLDGHLPRFSHEYPCDSPQQQRWFSMVVMPLGHDGAVISHTDITERKDAQKKLQLAAGVFTHALEGIMITTPQAVILDVNDAFTRITGYTRDEVLGQSPRMLSSGRHDADYYAAMWRSLNQDGYWYGEVWNRRKNGEVFAEMQAISAMRDAQGKVSQYISLFSDITERKAHESQLEHIAHFDALTNLPNRVLLADRLQQAMTQAQRRQQKLAVVYLDLDGFKAINDHHGHQTGDQVLITLAQRMKEALREGDTLARIGGDEFVAVLIDLQETQSSVPLLGRLLSAAAEPVQAGESVQVSASLGVTFYPQAHDIDADQLLRQADQAMYQAKLAGKNRYHFFDAAQDSSMRVHHESLERIRLALDRGEFVLHYQPKVNMHSGKVIGAEALIRWQHPEKGLLAPAAFLPVIEDHPLAVDVGEWVIDTALTQIELWGAAGLDLPVSVNIGARQLQQENFVQRLQALLARHPQVNAGSLELEVLETSALADIAQVSQVIEACATIGVKFALDDFGTGYSSLTYLKLLRVALLKIDQSFVRDMLDDPDDLAILQGVIGLALAFRREVIAEGVETVAHGTALLQLGCELAQGYGIARPMPPEQLPGWTAAWEPDAAWCELPWLGGQE